MLNTIRQNGAEYIIACMSGNFTQRGDFAVYDKYTRAKAALFHGADLVIELPVTYACAGAERFAFGGVSLLNAVGCIDTLYFGSEIGDIFSLENACHLITSPDISDKIKYYLSKGQTFAKARQNAAADIDSSLADILRSPNNILGIEYIKALQKLHSTILPCTVQRIGTDHDSLTPSEHIASATLIRQMILNGDSNVLQYIPEPVSSPIHQLSRLETAILYKLRMMYLSDFAVLPDISEGLENRIYSAVRNGCSLDEILTLAKTKRYTMARIRRIILYAFLGISKRDTAILPQYIKILGFNEKGRDILRMMKKSAQLPVIMRYADTKTLSADGQYLYNLESRCDDIYALSGETIASCGKNLTTNPIILSSCTKSP